MALEAIADIDQKIADQERSVAAISEAATINARAALTVFPAPTLDAGFAGLLRRTLDDVARDAEQQLADHLASHGLAAGGAEWIATGVEYAQGEDCPFCGRNIRGLPLVAAFRSVFSDSYKNLKEDITRQRADIERQFGDAAIARADTVAAQNIAAVEFWRQYCTFDSSLIALPATVAPAARSFGAAALALLDRKLGSPLDEIQPDDAYANAVTAYEEASQLLGATNQAIGQLNALIAAKKAETARADLRQAQAELAGLKTVKVRHTPDISTLCDDHTRVVAEKTAIDTRKDAVRRQLDTHTKTVVEPYERQPEAASAMMISSPQPRARRTAELVRDHLDKPTIPIQLDERLCEVSIGGWEGLSQQEISRLVPGTFEGEERHGWCFRAPGGESYGVFEARIRDWLSEAARNPSVIVVTHGTVGRVLRGLYLGLPSSTALALPIPQDKIFRLSNGAIQELEVEVSLKTPRIVKVTPLTALHLLVEFDDGVAGRIDIGKQLSLGIETFRNEATFQQVTINDFGAVCWPTGFTLSPDTAYDLARRQPSKCWLRSETA